MEKTPVSDVISYTGSRETPAARRPRRLSLVGVGAENRAGAGLSFFRVGSPPEVIDLQLTNATESSGRYSNIPCISSLILTDREQGQLLSVGGLASNIVDR